MSLDVLWRVHAIAKNNASQKAKNRALEAATGRNRVDTGADDDDVDAATWTRMKRELNLGVNVKEPCFHTFNAALTKDISIGMVVSPSCTLVRLRINANRQLYNVCPQAFFETFPYVDSVCCEFESTTGDPDGQLERGHGSLRLSSPRAGDGNVFAIAAEKTTQIIGSRDGPDREQRLQRESRGFSPKRVCIVNSPGFGGSPIASVRWCLVEGGRVVDQTTSPLSADDTALVLNQPFEMAYRAFEQTGRLQSFTGTVVGNFIHDYEPPLERVLDYGDLKSGTQHAQGRSLQSFDFHHHNSAMAVASGFDPSAIAIALAPMLAPSLVRILGGTVERTGIVSAQDLEAELRRHPAATKLREGADHGKELVIRRDSFTWRDGEMAAVGRAIVDFHVYLRMLSSLDHSNNGVEHDTALGGSYGVVSHGPPSYEAFVVDKKERFFLGDSSVLWVSADSSIIELQHTDEGARFRIRRAPGTGVSFRVDVPFDMLFMLSQIASYGSVRRQVNYLWGEATETAAAAGASLVATSILSSKLKTGKHTNAMLLIATMMTTTSIIKDEGNRNSIRRVVNDAVEAGTNIIKSVRNVSAHIESVTGSGLAMGGLAMVGLGVLPFVVDLAGGTSGRKRKRRT